MALTTYRYRIKDSSCRNKLRKMGFACNDVWNYCNEQHAYQWNFRRRLLSGFDLDKLTSGIAKDLCLHSQTIQAICQEYAKRTKQFKKVKLSWRSRKRTLGWIPFKSSSIEVFGNTIRYNKKIIAFWNSKNLPTKIHCGSFSEDAKGRWYVNLVCEETFEQRQSNGAKIGIDFGLKTIGTLSNGLNLNRENIFKKFERKLSIAQKARKKKIITSIHSKVKNKRKDWAHKTTTNLVRNYDLIAVGNVSSSRLKKTKMAKSVSDVGWANFKLMLAYKAKRLGVEYIEVNENFSTVTCSNCFERSGPRGLSGLGVRIWTCSDCNTTHNRDVNAAQNILNSAQDIVRRRESISA